MNTDPTQTYQDLIAFGRAAAAEGLLLSTCGNASLRVDDDHIAISGSGTELRDLAPEDIALVRLSDGAHVGGPKPSIELPMHAGVYRVRADAGAVLHSQSRAATVLACHEQPPRNLDFIPEIPAYVRKHVYVPYLSPGSGDLAGLVAEAFADPDVTVVQMQNHGQTFAGRTWTKTVRRAVFFELACWMALQSDALRTIPPADVELLRGYSRDF